MLFNFNFHYLINQQDPVSQLYQGSKNPYLTGTYLCSASIPIDPIVLTIKRSLAHVHIAHLISKKHTSHISQIYTFFLIKHQFLQLATLSISSDHHGHRSVQQHTVCVWLYRSSRLCTALPQLLAPPIIRTTIILVETRNKKKANERTEKVRTLHSHEQMHCSPVPPTIASLCNI